MFCRLGVGGWEGMDGSGSSLMLLLIIFAVSLLLGLKQEWRRKRMAFCKQSHMVNWLLFLVDRPLSGLISPFSFMMTCSWEAFTDHQLGPPGGTPCLTPWHGVSVSGSAFSCSPQAHLRWPTPHPLTSFKQNVAPGRELWLKKILILSYLTSVRFHSHILIIPNTDIWAPPWHFSFNSVPSLALFSMLKPKEQMTDQFSCLAFSNKYFLICDLYMEWEEKTI